MTERERLVRNIEQARLILQRNANDAGVARYEQTAIVLLALGLTSAELSDAALKLTEAKD